MRPTLVVRLAAGLVACGGPTVVPSAPSPSVTPSDAAPSDAAPPASSSSSSAPDADADAGPDLARSCEIKMGRELARRHVDFDAITSVRDVRIRLEVLGRMCAEEFPAWAEAASRASKTGVAGRNRIFGELLAGECPAVAHAKTGQDVADACPTFVGTLWGGSRPFYAHVEPGIFAFATLLRRHGFDGFAEELALQSCFHPELDP